MLELRDYQKEAVDRALNWFAQGGTTFRFNMCVGAGKTLTTIRTVESVPGIQGQRVVVAVHTTELVRQLTKETARDGEDSSIQWEFYTYQSLVKLAARMAAPHILVVDEAHCGGLAKEEGSYKTIINELSPAKIISLSATDYNLDTELFGPKTTDNSYVFTFQQGYMKGVLNQGIIRVIHSGLEQDLLADGGATTSINGATVAEVVQAGRQVGVDYSDDGTVNAISKAQAGEAFARYMFSEQGQSAIFFCASIAQAKYLVEDLFAKTGITAAVATSAHAKEAKANIKKFRDREIQVICTVDMLKEGSNFPFLEVAFDLKPSSANHARTMEQKLGRILRKNGNTPKAPSRFYIVMAAPRAHSWDPDKVNGAAKEQLAGLSEQDQELSLASHELVSHMAVDGQLPAEFRAAQRDEVGSDNPLIEALNSALGKKTLAPMTEHRYIVTEARGSREVATFDVRKLYTNRDNSEANKAELLTMARAGMPRIDKKHRLWIALVNYTSPSSGSYDPNFKSEVEKYWPLKFVRHTWTTKKLKESAKLYQTRWEWKKNAPSAYAIALKRGLLDMCCEHMSSIYETWTLEKIKESARQYQTRKEWERGDRKAYHIAHQRGLLDACCTHMNSSATRRRRVRELNSGIMYESIGVAAQILEIRRSDISAVLSGKQKHTKGYTFAYVDEQQEETQ